MAEINKAPRGTNDVLPEDSYKWQFVEQKLTETAGLYGFKEIRVPVFEHTEVFTKNVGDTTDVVQKEMYTFTDKGDRSITLRPEFTAGVIRSVIENSLTAAALPVKVCYHGGCYRYEKPQAGRLREFHQFGAECVGAASPAADAEIIAMANQLLKDVGIRKISLEINSIGCPECRKVYHSALKKYFEGNKDELCATCRDRLERNPMRILDCKSPICADIAKSAPNVTDYLCEDCDNHFKAVQAHLTAMDINFKVNPRIVRGLDYYTRTVFEFISGDIGAQATVCGGGRYDGLLEQMGGQPQPALGFAMGIERLLMVLESQNAELPEPKKCDLYIAPMGEVAAIKASVICSSLRDEGFEALTDIVGRGLKAQMRYANKIGAAYTVVLGDSELESGLVRLKCMETGGETETELDMLSDTLYNAKILDFVDRINIENENRPF
ncbi:MAG: histidine--tRNA ligase [Clostridia bacterium]|nr:histidine--tRNA ligase [Clostridia bacterium]